MNLEPSIRVILGSNGTSGTSAINGSAGTSGSSGTSFVPAYGSIYEDTPAGTLISLTLQNTYYGWVNATDDIHLLTTFTNDATADKITISAGGAGYYRVAIIGTCLVSTTANSYHVALFKNNSIIAKATQEFRTSNVGNWINFAMSDIVVAAVNDNFDVRFNNITAAARSVTIYHLNFNMNRISL